MSDNILDLESDLRRRIERAFREGDERINERDVGEMLSRLSVDYGESQ